MKEAKPIFIKADKVIHRYQKMYKVTAISAPDYDDSHPNSRIHIRDDALHIYTCVRQSSYSIRVGDLISIDSMDKLTSDMIQAVTHDRALIASEHLEGWKGEFLFQCEKVA